MTTGAATGAATGAGAAFGKGAARTGGLTGTLPAKRTSGFVSEFNRAAGRITGAGAPGDDIDGTEVPGGTYSVRYSAVCDGTSDKTVTVAMLDIASPVVAVFTFSPSLSPMPAAARTPGTGHSQRLSFGIRWDCLRWPAGMRDIGPVSPPAVAGRALDAYTWSSTRRACRPDVPVRLVPRRRLHVASRPHSRHVVTARHPPLPTSAWPVLPSCNTAVRARVTATFVVCFPG